ncbi:hypothetical protein [Hoeflea sp.]
MKRRYETPKVDKRGKLADSTAFEKVEPKISGITIILPDEPL